MKATKSKKKNKTKLELITAINIHSLLKRKGNIYLYKSYTQIFREALFAIAKTWKQSTYSSGEEWINKLQCIHKVEYYSAMGKKKLLLHTWHG